MDFDSCANQCESIGASMLCVEDRQTNEFIGEYLLEDNRNHNSYGPWIAVSDTAQEGNFVGVRGCSSTYRNWAPWEPNNYHGNEDCVHFLTYGLYWNDLPCSGRELYCICERAPAPSSSPTSSPTPEPSVRTSSPSASPSLGAVGEGGDGEDDDASSVTCIADADCDGPEKCVCEDDLLTTTNAANATETSGEATAPHVRRGLRRRASSKHNEVAMAKHKRSLLFGTFNKCFCRPSPSPAT